MPLGHGQGVFLWATMGRLAKGDLRAGWQACKRQTVLGAADHKGEGDNLDRRRIKCYAFVSALLMLRIIPSAFLMFRFVTFT